MMCTVARTARLGVAEVAVVKWYGWGSLAPEVVTASVLVAWTNTAACSEHAVAHRAVSSPAMRAEEPRNRSVDHGDSGAQDDGR